MTPERIVRDQFTWWERSGFTPDDAYQALTGICCVRATWDDVLKLAIAWAERTNDAYENWPDLQLPIFAEFCRYRLSLLDMAANGPKPGDRRVDFAAVEKAPRHRKHRVLSHAV